MFWFCAVSACSLRRSVASTRADSAACIILEGEVRVGAGPTTGSASLEGVASCGSGSSLDLRVIVGGVGGSVLVSSSGFSLKPSTSESGMSDGKNAGSSAGFVTNIRGSACSSSLSSKFQNCFSASHHSTTRLRLAIASRTCTYQFRPCQSG